ncbi:MAG: hypothetical protein AAF578_00320 [Pseudomonadota bacterium]
MIIQNYSDLQQAVAAELARNDLLPYIDGFIQRCESKLYRTLNLRHEETALNVPIIGGVAAVPGDFKALRHAYYDMTPVQWLDWVQPADIYKDYPDRGVARTPCVISREAGNFIFGPTAEDGTLRGIYYAKTPSVRTTGTNWYVINAPEVLLYGSLLEATPFIRNDERLPVWQSFYVDAVATLETEERFSKHSQGPIRQRSG